MLSEAMREELIERNVATVVRPPSVQRVEVQPWSTEEASRFLATSADHRLHALFAVGVALELRKGELLGLRLDDVDLVGGVVHVRQNVQRLPEVGLVFGPPKSTKSRRTIPLPAASVKLLRTHRANQAAEALALVTGEHLSVSKGGVVRRIDQPPRGGPASPGGRSVRRHAIEA